MKKLLSRKLWVALSALATIIISAVSKELPWSEAVPSMAAVAIGYCVAQGWIDAKEIENAISHQEDAKE
tara:strand:+ start:265 stop:471 length:207 start_codon:yes stop_codon:yes gene_type:complete